ncbi:ABC transporter permease [Nonomuraea sp. NN258]|uniref:ABC transporter permease n=1 Tax=Nonomuraea antri TaxID=2730852 RepID=UPI001567D261|nr:ABC transporter permease [Nonomuraea antri]NRQ30398.1 ABC transporter permease [Nonomuraea antri]
MRHYARAEVLRMARNRRYVLFTVLFPVVIYLVNANLYGDRTGAGGVRMSTLLMVSMAAYGALSSSMMSSAVPWAQERQTGWLRQLQITPLPAWAIIVTKLGVALLLTLPALLLVALVAVTQQGVSLAAGQWAALLPALWLGTLPFIALGLAIGSVLSADAALPAAMISMFALSIAGGLWFPPEALNGTLRAVAELTPSYHYANLGWSVAGGAGLPVADVLIVAGWTLALGAAAAYLYRRATVRR